MSQTSIERLIYLLSKVPGFGIRSARRGVLHMIRHRDNLMLPLLATLEEVSTSIKICECCCNIDITSPCAICLDDRRDKSTICIIESVADLWAMERGEVFKGQYHVLGGTLSASENRAPEDLNISQLIKRLSTGEVEEIILATNATVDGQTTAYYITELLEGKNVKISRIAYGIPVGGELDYIDEGTLSIALKTRQPF